MNRLPTLGLLALLLCFTAFRLRAQELSVLGGATTSGAFDETSKAWEVDYRQDIYRNFDASVSYINEGHFLDHKRDGTAWEGWFNLPIDNGHIAFSAGAGIYYYYDTQTLPGGNWADVHGTAPIFSLAATGYLSDRWFYRVMVNRISPNADVQTTAVVFGVGYWFGPNRRPRGAVPDKGSPNADYVTEPQLTAFGGQSIVNSLDDGKAWAGAVEYRQGILPHLDGTASAIYEGDPKTVRRSGLGLQLWPVNTFIDDSTSVGIGVGPYIYIDRKHPAADTRESPAALAPLVSLTIARRISASWITRLVWDRVTSNYNRDSDIFLLGLGYCWR
jgi:hypothetical protein